jgi:peptidyl-prolyl cis-trans isomerase SurA
VQTARAKAQEVLEQLRAGADFRQMAITHSAGQQALQGGDLGWRKGGQLPTLFADSVLRLAPGEVSEPLRSSSGFHIIKLIDKRGEQREYVTQTHARHILIRSTALVSDTEARARLERLRERILQGEDFAELARANSEDPGSGAKGGDLGWANPGTFVGPFEQAMNKLQPGEISEPFRSQFGWHIVQVIERRQRDSTEELKRARAHDAIRQRKIEEETQDWLRRLRDEAYVEYKD